MKQKVWYVFLISLIIMFGIALMVFRKDIKGDLIRCMEESKVIDINGKVLDGKQRTQFIELLVKGTLAKNDYITETTPDYSIEVIGYDGRMEHYWIYYVEYVGGDSDMSHILQVDSKTMKSLLEELFVSNDATNQSPK